jgi:thiamine-phosphate pyrophosphorylase
MRGLYAIVDPEICANAHSPKAPLEVARSILTGGCAALQLRDKHADDAAYVQLACDIAALCRQAGVPMIVNDRFWLARAIGAQGVHVGQSDAPIDEVRALVGPDVSIGVSTHSLAQARQAQARGADMVGFGPIFPTTSKLAADPVVGLEQLAEVCLALTIPVVAIGGITRENVASVRAAGARLAAVISAVCKASDPEVAARELHSGL